MKHIVVIGLGGVGGYFGFKINQANSNKHQVSFIARGETFKKVSEHGLTLLSPEHPEKVTKPNAVLENISEIKTPDLVLVCVKEYDLENVCQQLATVITDDTIILPMMNGADIYDRIRKVLPLNTILPSCVYVASHIKEKGIVEHKGKAGKLIFGRDPQHYSRDIDWVKAIISDSGIHFSFKDNSLSEIWTKFIFIASFGMVTAKYNSSIGQVCNDPQQHKEAAAIMEEIKQIADRKNIELNADIVVNTFEKAATFPPQTPTSLQLDVNTNKGANELELFAGAIIKYGTEVDVPTPATQKIYKEIKAGL
ncbi:2-dehydropantoate 2-reductase [Limibacter armeniacum]|uniref:ketopantoate reductase family protein n=1 Tax=Limibacter armeniacum TaxID=466084 RepID=UPI002FE5EA95